ncbi:CU044_2847 family protein [Gloeothece verrucosa]|uniref:Trypsin-co-occurring domain-containing protein n=1 Tax=Gloeothece verrucosa (strain PCC 7822) TaxID=497965 RepID=E0UHX6_GLOV7|nr:CU044_2847 family protein [Gloeothece verrucosa]ADN14506.1 hypothetical protein Cyan7822_2534 [Gloeothece verrucosa PCC 7822]
MSKVKLYFQREQQLEELDVNLETLAEPSEIDENDIDEMGWEQITIDKTRQLIRDYTEYALSAFKNFPTANVKEVTLKFGIKIGGKAGIPFITEGTAEGNLEIEVKCELDK